MIFKLKFSNVSNIFANHAHADLFEFLGEYGLIGSVLLISSFLKFFYDKQSFGFVNILLLSLSSFILFFDFSFHVPVIQILFVIFFIFNKKLFG